MNTHFMSQIFVLKIVLFMR